jgi:hypothetical protein
MNSLDKLHPTWKRKLRWIMVDNPICMCPYCGNMTQYPDDVCDKCNREVLPVKGVLIDG